MNPNDLPDDLLEFVVGELDDARQPAMRKALADDADLAAAVQGLTTAAAAVRAENVGQLSDEFNDRLRRQVLEVFDGVQAVRRRPTFRTRSLTNWRWIMRQPISRVAAVAIFALALGGVTLWFHASGTTLALADFLDPILEAKTATCKATGEMEGNQRVTIQLMVLAPFRMRMEQEMHKSRVVMISDAQKGKSLHLIPSLKLATIYIDTNTNPRKPSKNLLLDLRSQLLDARNNPDYRREPLGEKDIDGRHVVGYRLSGHGSVVDLWGDPKTGLPVRMGVTSAAFPKLKELVVTDFAFNPNLEESLFSLEPPAGYKVQTIKTDSSPANEKDLVETFHRYSKLSGGTFPDVLDLAALMQFSMEHFEKSRPRRQQKLNEEQKSQERLDEMKKLTHGLGFVFEELPPEADAHYAGKGVSFGAADKPIFWYRPKDAKKYRVIYADLSVRDALAPPHVPNAQPVPDPASPKK